MSELDEKAVFSLFYQIVRHAARINRKAVYSTDIIIQNKSEICNEKGWPFRTSRDILPLFAHAEPLEDTAGDVLPDGGSGDLPQGFQGSFHVGQKQIRGHAQV